LDGKAGENKKNKLILVGNSTRLYIEEKLAKFAHFPISKKSAYYLSPPRSETTISFKIKKKSFQILALVIQQ
jgi:hypothetical protein